MRLLIRWLLIAGSLMVIANFVSGFYVRNYGAALIAAAVIALVNATLGALVKVLTFPLTILTLGLFLVVVNAAMLKVAAWFIPRSFEVQTWTAAIIASVLLSLVSAILHSLLGDRRRERQ